MDGSSPQGEGLWPWAERLGTRLLMTGAGLLILLWFGRAILDALLILFLAAVLAIVLSAPVTLLKRKGMGRGLASAVVLGTVLAVFALLGWLVLPKVASQVASLVQDLPYRTDRLLRSLSDRLSDQPALQEALPSDLGHLFNVMPRLGTVLGGVGRMAAPVLTVVATVLLLLAIVVYAVIRPHPLLRLYLSLFPVGRQDQAARAFSRASTMVVGWMRSNLLVGAIEAGAAGAFLAFMGVPGAVVWAALTFFGELVPKVGPYLAAIPPVLVAFADDPAKALWIAVFYLAMNEVMGDLVTPRIRASTMNLHPASTLAMVLVMGAAFGIPGALIATPMAAFVKAYFEEFHLAGRPVDSAEQERVDAMLAREADAA